MEEYLKGLFGNDWYEVLKPVLTSELFIKTMRTVDEQYASPGIMVSPSSHMIFRAFKECPIDKVKCILVGQDPYPDGINATGLAFGIPKKSSQIPLSLRNIIEEIVRTRPNSTSIDFDHTLESWAHQGVLLLNSALTVQKGKPNSHKNLWNPVVSSMLDYIVYRFPYHPLIVFGNDAKRILSEYTKKHSIVLFSPHPAASRYPNSAGAVGSDVFEHTNIILTKPLYKLNKQPIDWLTKFANIEPKDEAPY